MSEIRVLSVEDFDAFVNILVNAYPGWKIAPQDKEGKERVKQRLLKAHQEEPTITAY